MNLRFGLASDGTDGWACRKKSLKTLLDRHAADFMGFQEANDFQIDYIDALLKDHGYIGRRSPAPPFWQSNVLFYHRSWCCRHRDHFFLSPTPDIPSRFRESKWPRQCTMGLFQRAGRKVICINTHLDFSPTVQTDSARIILRRLLSLSKTVPAIVMGDFNTGPDSACHAVFAGSSPHFPENARRFKNVFDPPYPGTFHGFTGKTDGDHIDWILYSGDVVPRTCRVLSQTFAGRYPSDHFPVTATFTGSPTAAEK